jgi:hypothetical protein
VLSVTPAAFERCHELIREGAEGRDGARLGPFVERALAVGEEGASGGGPVAGLGEGDIASRAEAHLALLALPAEDKQPTPTSAVVDGEI